MTSTCMVVARTQLDCNLQTLIEVLPTSLVVLPTITLLSSLRRNYTCLRGGGGGIAIAEPIPRNVGWRLADRDGRSRIASQNQWTEIPWTAVIRNDKKRVLWNETSDLGDSWADDAGLYRCRLTRHMSVTAVARRAMPWYIYPKGNIKSFIGVMPHVNTIWIYDEKLVHYMTFLWLLIETTWFVDMQHLCGTTDQTYNCSIWFAHICHCLFQHHYFSFTTSCFPRLEWPHSYIGLLLLTRTMSSRVDTQAYTKHGAFRSLGGPDNFFSWRNWNVGGSHTG